MKVAILTLPLHNNFGGNLQAYALMEYLKSIGIQPTLLRCEWPEKTDLAIFKSIAKRFFYKLMGRKDVYVLEELFKKYDKKIISYYSDIFINTFINSRTKPCYSADELRKEVLDNNFDAVVVGSDQVWRPEYTPNIFNYFLDFLSENMSIKKISYAASFGSGEWVKNSPHSGKLKKLVNLFDAVSVRESNSVNIIKDNFSVNSSHVLDPTMIVGLDAYYKIVTDNDLEKIGTPKTWF